MKGKGKVYGERIATEKYLPLLEIEQCGRDEFVDLSNPEAIDRELAQNGLKRAAEALQSRQYGLVVLDEICVAMACGLVSTAQVKELLAGAPEGTDLVLTGRYCPGEILAIADMVSEVRGQASLRKRNTGKGRHRVLGVSGGTSHVSFHCFILALAHPIGCSAA